MKKLLSLIVLTSVLFAICATPTFAFESIHISAATPAPDNFVGQYSYSVSYDDMILINHSSYISSLDTIMDFGDNSDGTCGGVAGSIFMQYYQSLLPGGIVPQNYSNAVSLYSWSIPYGTVYDLHDGFGFNVWNLNPVTTIGDNLHRYIYYLMEESTVPGIPGAVDHVFGVYNYQIYSGLTTYINDLPCVSNLTLTYNANMTSAQVASCIDSNYPVCAVVYASGTSAYTPITNFRHVIVIYGYCYNSIENRYYFIGNFGYEYEDLDANVTIFPEEYFAHFGVYTPNGTSNVTYNHSLHYTAISNTQHRISCTNCDAPLGSESHHYVKKICIDCGYIKDSGSIIEGETEYD